MIPAHFSDQHIQETLAPYSVLATPSLCEGIRSYISLLLLWNSKIALTTITEPDAILRVHFGESLFAGASAGMHKGRLADIGTGPGFPGIPIRMANPATQLSLVEIVTKKTAFLGEVVRKLALSKVEIVRGRMEAYKPSGKFDFITARALGHYDALSTWAAGALSDHGKLVVLLGEKEVLTLQADHDWTWDPPVRVPGTDARFVLMGTPKRS